MYQFLADLVLFSHVLFVLFVILGLLLTVIGGIRRWGWIRNFRFRIAHLLGIAIVVAQTWLEVICPLTTLEMWLRGKTGEQQYSGSFVQHWLQALLYYDAPWWVFTALYTMFGLLVVIVWLKYPPRWPRSKRST